MCRGEHGVRLHRKANKLALISNPKALPGVEMRGASHLEPTSATRLPLNGDTGRGMRSDRNLPRFPTSFRQMSLGPVIGERLAHDSNACPRVIGDDIQIRTSR